MVSLKVEQVEDHTNQINLRSARILCAGLRNELFTKTSTRAARALRGGGVVTLNYFF